MSDLTSDAHGHEHPKNELSDYAKRIYAIRDLKIPRKHAPPNPSCREYTRAFGCGRDGLQILS